MILIFGGTSDSLEIAECLNDRGMNYIFSVATEYGKDLYSQNIKNLIMGRMDEGEMVSFFKKNDINTVIDASHPHADIVSQNAIKASKELGVKYIRYERKKEDVEDSENIYDVESVDEASQVANRIGKRIFLATGSKTLPVFTRKLEGKDIFARVLPTSSVIKLCEDAGLMADNIIAMKGPFTSDINKSLYQFYNADTLITKESGKAGGFMEKIYPAIELSMNVIIIGRPRVDYPNLVSSKEELVELLNGRQ